MGRERRWIGTLVGGGRPRESGSGAVEGEGGDEKEGRGRKGVGGLE